MRSVSLVWWRDVCSMGHCGFGFIIHDERELCGAWMVRLLLLRLQLCVWIPSRSRP